MQAQGDVLEVLRLNADIDYWSLGYHDHLFALLSAFGRGSRCVNLAGLVCRIRQLRHALKQAHDSTLQPYSSQSTCAHPA